ncbi:ABATE domain-containing protein [Saccharopolyspora gregorii]|uniref:ABATE domain-containing protein n=1 Tax=Saccharopolyspora gregorii TaxID=33914 RepID=UPI003CD06FD9
MLDGQHDPAIRTAVDLANTVKPITGADELETVQHLADFLDRHAPAAPGPRHPTRADLAEVRALRGTVRAVLERASTDAGRNRGPDQRRPAPQPSHPGIAPRAGPLVDRDDLRHRPLRGAPGRDHAQRTGRRDRRARTARLGRAPGCAAGPCSSTCRATARSGTAPGTARTGRCRAYRSRQGRG